jgi:hypothetical protein
MAAADEHYVPYDQLLPSARQVFQDRELMPDGSVLFYIRWIYY